MRGCVNTSGKYVLHQRQFWHMQRLQGASSMYQGGCYQTGASSPGNTLCTAASEGKCTKAAEGHFVPPGATAAKQSVVKCDDIAGVLVDSTTCKGIDKCATCTAPSSGQTAACTACVDGHFAGSSGASCTVCVDPCKACKGANNRCASCRPDTNPYFKEGGANDGTGACVAEGGCATHTFQEQLRRSATPAVTLTRAA